MDKTHELPSKVPPNTRVFLSIRTPGSGKPAVDRMHPAAILNEVILQQLTRALF